MLSITDAQFEHKWRPISQEKGKSNRFWLILTIFTVLGVISALGAIEKVLNFDDRTNPFNLTTNDAYYQFFKSDNTSFNYVSTGACSVYPTLFYNYTSTKILEASAGLIQTVQNGNVTLPLGCLKNPIELRLCDIPSPFDAVVQCRDTGGTWNSLSSDVDEDYTAFFINIPYKREYLSIPKYAYVQNVTIELTGVIYP